MSVAPTACPRLGGPQPGPVPGNFGPGCQSRRRWPMLPDMATHEIANQPPPWSTGTSSPPTGPWSARCVARAPAGPRGSWPPWGGGWARPRSWTGGRQANRYPPVLHAFDRFGGRRDEVEFHPAWHAQGALLVRHAPEPVAEAFCASRLGAESGHTFGTLPATLAKSAIAEIMERARP